MKMKAKKLPPSRSPTAFATATVGSRKIRSGISGAAARASITRKASSSAAETASSVTVRADPHPAWGAIGTGAARTARRPRPGARPGGVEGGAGPGERAFRDDARGEHQRRRPDRHVEEEDVLPAGVPGEQPAGDQADG